MKGEIIFSTMLVFLLAFGLLFVSCGELKSDSYDGEFEQLNRDNTITFSGEAKVGKTLTATSTGSGFKADSVFEWVYYDNPSADKVTQISGGYLSGANNSVLTVNSSFEGKYIRVSRRLYKDFEGCPYYKVRKIGPVTW